MNTQINIATFVLDDDEFVTKVIEGALLKSDVKNVKVFNQAVQFLSELTPEIHICIIDVELRQKMTGLEVMKRVLKMNENSFIIITSSTRDAFVLEEFINCGCNRFVLKGGEKWIEKITTHVKFGIEYIQRTIETYSTIATIREEFRKIKEDAG